MSDTDTREPDANRYPQIVRAVRETPWAILPGTLAVILDVVGQRVAGEKFSDEEIKARVGTRAAGRPSNVVGQVAVIPIYGAIIPKATLFSEMSGGTSIQGLQDDFRAALADEDVKAIVFDVDSPGGMTDMVPEFAAEIRAARGQKPMVAVANTRAASAAYWLASQADELVATPSGDVGSIGVFAAHEDISAMQEKLGVKRTYISAGKYKTEGNPSEPLTDDAKAAIQTRVDEMYDVFTGDVAKARGTTVQAVKEGYGEGRMLSAARAAAAGMIDRVDTLEAVISRLQNGSGRSRVASRSAEELPEPIDADSETPKFSDAVDEALRAFDTVVNGAEALRALTGVKRDQLTALLERGQLLLTQSEEAQNDDTDTAGDGLDLELALAETDARLRF